ncbi:hypothetical protein CsSME_00032218 [Camellia sinensis var. sinensis]
MSNEMLPFKKLTPEYSTVMTFEDNLNQVKLEELPLFKFEKLAIATNKFHETNKPGQGGFGPVYKAWKLWNEDNIVTLIDPVISYQYFRQDILRYIHVGLLCVQEFAVDRPTISTVLSMLKSEISYLPTPKQPAFTQRPKRQSLQQSQSGHSRNELTITIVDGR